MSETEIPADIWEAAKDKFEQHCMFTQHMLIEQASAMAKRAIAYAIMEERRNSAAQQREKDARELANMAAREAEWIGADVMARGRFDLLMQAASAIRGDGNG